MASIRNLKKDIESVIAEVVMDCYICIYEYPDKDLSGFEALINDAIQFKEDLFSRINHVSSDEDKVKGSYQQIKTDVTAGIRLFYERMEALVN